MKPKKVSLHSDILIIGGGMGGLAAAALLARDGYSVRLIEKNKILGGRANLLKEKGFTFDMGPSWYMMPDVFEKFFAQFDKKPTDFMKLEKLDPQYRVIFPDKTHVDIRPDIEQNKKVFESIEKGAGKKLVAYLAEAKLKYEISIRSVLYKNADSIFDFLSFDLIKNGSILRPFQNMNSYVQEFFKSEKLQQLIQFTLVFLGGAPHNMPALYSLISHVDFTLHTFYPKGGMYELVKSLISLGKSEGVEFLTDTAATELFIADGKITGVKTKSGTYTAQYVISNTDTAHLESLFSDKEMRMFDESYWEKKAFAPSAFLMYLGVKGSVKNVEHHTIFFGKDWKRHFSEIFDKPDWPLDPSVYINVPSMTDKTMAPEGHTGVMILVPIATHLRENENWKEQYGEYILRYLEEKADIVLRKNIVYKKIFSVSDFTATYNSFAGNALGGLAHTLFQTGPFRPSNIHKKLDNLFFVGAGTVPGIGLPSVIVSAHLVRDRIRAAEKENA